ncbi:energy transducer TonB [bacterium]|nr:MAG: energy transducer TonB [bacterium]
MSNIDVIDGFERENYGSYVLKKVYSKNLAAGLIIGVALHIGGIASYYISNIVMQEDRIITVKFTDINELQNAPPLQDAPPPPTVKIEIPDVIKPAMGMPIIVPDEEALPELTIQTQEEIKTDIASSTFGDQDGEIRVDISGVIQGISGNDEPGMDEFVVVEQNPVPLGRPNIVYPELAKKAGLEGKVVVKALIDETGSVTKIVVIAGEDIFKDAAVAAIKQMKFKPAINGNRAVKVWITYPVVFRLN